MGGLPGHTFRLPTVCHLEEVDASTFGRMKCKSWTVVAIGDSKEYLYVYTITLTLSNWFSKTTQRNPWRSHALWNHSLLFLTPSLPLAPLRTMGWNCMRSTHVMDKNLFSMSLGASERVRKRPNKWSEGPSILRVVMLLNVRGRRYAAFTTSNCVGLQLLPHDGNSHNSLAYLAHPGTSSISLGVCHRGR